MHRADEAPDEANGDDAQRDVAGDFMRAEPGFAGDPGDRDRRHETPVQPSDQRVPYLHGAAGVHGERCAQEPCLTTPIFSNVFGLKNASVRSPFSSKP